MPVRRKCRWGKLKEVTGAGDDARKVGRGSWIRQCLTNPQVQERFPPAWWTFRRWSPHQESASHPTLHKQPLYTQTLARSSLPGAGSRGFPCHAPGSRPGRCIFLAVIAAVVFLTRVKGGSFKLFSLKLQCLKWAISLHREGPEVRNHLRGPRPSPPRRLSTLVSIDKNSLGGKWLQCFLCGVPAQSLQSASNCLPHGLRE